jgi:hypothetical protein
LWYFEFDNPLVKNVALKLVAVFEIVSGLSGLSLTMVGLTGMSAFIELPRLCYGVLPLTSVAAGVFLWKRLKLGVVLSILVQLLQIPVIRTDDFSLDFIAAMKLPISAVWCAGDNCRVKIVLGVDFLALAALLLLLWCWSDLQNARASDSGIEQALAADSVDR